MKIEYNCSYDNNNTTQYAMRYVNYSEITRLHSIFDYINALSLDASLLQDLELVLINPLYKNIIMTPKPIAIDDALPLDDEEYWEVSGIDELLIPNDDYPWETVKQDMFDWETGQPKEPIKQIDEYTYIAKMPVTNPITADWNIGRKYIDVDVTWLKYMIKVFNKAWQSNIFKYGAMDMMTGINTMLEYMRLYAAFNVPGQFQEQCERVVSLIRWYAEHVLLKHSQFVIHIEYDDWKSDLHTGELNCEHQMLNFEITDSFVLRNTYNHAILLLKRYVCIDGQISFSVFLDGDADIYINGELASSISTGCSDTQTFNLPAGDIEFKFDFTGNEVKIGNIIINNTSVKDISTEYKYEYGKANFGITEVINSVKRYFKLTEDNFEAFKEAYDGVISLNDLTNRLKDYMELHHVDKQKGKRVTIKRI